LLRLSVLQKIHSGQFAREFIREMKTGRTRYPHLLRQAENHPLPCCRTTAPPKSSEFLIISPYDGLK
jgi:ketol-acid reductoisomerase